MTKKTFISVNKIVIIRLALSPLTSAVLQIRHQIKHRSTNDIKYVPLLQSHQQQHSDSVTLAEHLGVPPLSLLK